MTITLGKQKKVSFDGPYRVDSWSPVYRAALYAIMLKTPEDKYRILYFGESENLSERGFYKSHHKYDCWLNQCKAESKMYIGIHLMPNSSQEERIKLEKMLIEDYSPGCND